MKDSQILQKPDHSQYHRTTVTAGQAGGLT